MMKRVEQCIAALQQGKLNTARRIMKAIKNKGSDLEKYSLAEQLHSLGFLNFAETLYQDLLKKYPEEGELLIALAETYIDMDRTDEALLLLEKITPDDPVYVQALLLLADLYQLQGLYEVSEEKLKEAEKLAPDEIVIIFAQAELYNSLGRFAEAIYKYKQVLKEAKEFAGVS